MKKSDLLYIWVLISSYFAGVVAYTLSLFLFYNEKMISWGQLFTWTAPTFFTVNLLLFLLSIFLLKLMKKYFFWTQTILFAIVAIIPVYIIPILSGFFNFASIAYPISQEGFPFYIFFLISSLMSSYGIWIAQKQFNHRSFLIFSFVIIVVFIILIALN
ncbi:hypothetical protein PAECIP112173_03386 [Paenibacillus sp. JJ-100]|uniref:hypothetical protein n=1 Tax=Paenibacillus sp. JJ-100 TaxID=2974896 RepID=UPI0022FF780A|nr:hypothetical protein [Paenibacillus sp. JJ-100]CAI6081968.1 hypothetical protein PAECIP112173_03386 [Paenibacillus sp. JJ-100]